MDTYKIQAEPDWDTITVSGGTLLPFKEVPGAVITETQAILPFSHTTASLLFSFLKGKDYDMSLRTKGFLRILMDQRHTEHKDFIWALDLYTLQDEIINSRSKALRTNWDLIHYMPLRYLDKNNPQNITDLVLDTWAVVAGEIISLSYNGKADASIVEIRDMTGATITAWFFRQSWLRTRFSIGEAVILSGTFSTYKSKYTGVSENRITNATIDKLFTYDTGRKVSPVYSEKAGKKKWTVQQSVEALLNRIGWIEDPVPEPILQKYGFMTRNDAYRKIHFPDSIQEAFDARQRIAFDDFVRLQVFLKNRKDKEQTTRKGASMPYGEWADQFVNSLPFDFTGAQTRVAAEIAEDMSLQKPMKRLLHGDVGSGKTEIATTAILRAIQSGKQVAVLAPTSILATQLHARFERDIVKAGLDIKLGLLASKMRVKPRREIIQGVSDGSLQLLVGTHAILNTDIQFKDLGVIVIDEQHRFGTKHRQALTDNFLLTSETTPDVLMMSATPIPRTMSQTIYGDMDLSVIDEYPADRKPVITYWDQDDTGVWEKIREEVTKGHQAYVIAALVEESESEKMENVENATATHAFLQSSIFPDLSVGLVHGRMKAEEKEAVLNDYYANKIQVLVSTSVIEVGVNVPNATVMTILNANRFGIASLHQIRGRVGRGSAQGYCYLIGEATNPDTEERLNALVISTDGFWLAEKDLEIRGEGSLISSNQHGANDMIVANLREHKKILEIACRVAEPASKSEKMQKEVEYIFKSQEINA